MGAAPSRNEAARTEGAEIAPFHTFGIGWDRTSAPIASTPASTPSTDSVNRMPFSGVVSRPSSIRKQASLVTPVIVPVIGGRLDDGSHFLLLSAYPWARRG